MLGEKLGELQGKVVTRRVIEITNTIGPNVEVTIQREGDLKGVDVFEMVTYNSIRSIDGSWHAEGRGFLTTADNTEMITHSGKGIGKFTSPKGLEYKGSLFFNKSITPNSGSEGKLGFLDNIVTVFEVEDNIETGKSNIGLWEWK